MAYVRRRGNQLSIVVGERDPATHKVEQRVLFTLYSKPEALEMLGRGTDSANAARFERLLTAEHPDLRFDWNGIRGAVAADLDHLPETYEYKSARLTGQFRQDLVAFTRGLVLADPQHLASAGALVRENRAALEYLQDLIAWRLATCGEEAENEWTADNSFYWRFAMQGESVPPEAEEHAAGFWERRDLPRAEAAFLTLVDAFPSYAEGWNYLGLVALERKDLALAEHRFRKTIELGRAQFPKRVARSSYWKDLKTRPYMRGLRNLALTLTRAGELDEVAVLATRLDEECGDVLTAASYRAAVAMNAGDWKTAVEAAVRLGGVWPDERLVEAFARFERGEMRQAVEAFLHGALTNPLAARIVLGLPSADPKSATEADDHNAGVQLLMLLGGYLGPKSLRVRRFFTRVVCHARIGPLLDRVVTLRAAWFGQSRAERAVFDELTHLQSEAFALSQVEQLADLFADVGSADGAVELRGRGPGRRRPRCPPPDRVH